jgi:hypothetical protein
LVLWAKPTPPSPMTRPSPPMNKTYLSHTAIFFHRAACPCHAGRGGANRPPNRSPASSHSRHPERVSGSSAPPARRSPDRMPRRGGHDRVEKNRAPPGRGRLLRRRNVSRECL